MQRAARPDITQASSRLHVKVGILCALAVMMDGFDAQAMGFVAPSLLADWHITRVALSKEGLPTIHQEKRKRLRL